MAKQAPGYLSLYGSGELAARVERARIRLRDCVLCLRNCRVDRLAGELGECRTGALARVQGVGPHFGEEAPLVGRGGSGTIFFAGCNLDCVFCQNDSISHPAGDPAPALRGGVAGDATPAYTTPGGVSPSASVSSGAAENSGTATGGVVRAAAPDGAPRAGASGNGPSDGSADAGSRAPGAGVPPLRWEVPPERLAEMMLALQDAGCENINFVSPSHVVPQILEALVPAVEGGLRLPLVYNTGGYDALGTLRLLDGVIDIYMPDMKYADDRVGERLSGVPDYVRRNRAAVLEMHRQVGDLVLDERGVARRGLLVRHLVLPGDLAGTAEVARFLADEVSADTYVNVMDQYHPAREAARYPEICRRSAVAEYRAAVQETLAAGLQRLDGREVGGPV